MKRVLVETGELSVPRFKGDVGVCPGCQLRSFLDLDLLTPEPTKKMISKCGEIMDWHWAHPAGSECVDDWMTTEEDNAWSRSVMGYFPEDNTERWIGRRCADILTDRGFVIDLHSSVMATDTLVSKEDYFGQMAFLYNFKQEKHDKDTGEVIKSWRTDGRVVADVEHGALLWRTPREAWLFGEKPVVFDTYAGVFIPHRVEGWRFSKSSLRFYGRFMSMEDFASGILDGSLELERLVDWRQNAERRVDENYGGDLCKIFLSRLEILRRKALSFGVVLHSPEDYVISATSKWIDPQGNPVEKSPCNILEMEYWLNCVAPFIYTCTRRSDG